jgi:hypothetical protein
MYLDVTSQERQRPLRDRATYDLMIDAYLVFIRV